MITIFGTFAKIDPYIYLVLDKISYFCKKILNNICVEGCVLNFKGAISTGGAVKIPRMKCGFCLENSFSHKYISGSIQNPHFIRGVFPASPVEIAPLKLNTQK